MDDYLDILREWQESVARPFVYEHAAELFPAFQLRRVYPGNPQKDHWASRYKLDLTLPKSRSAEKTVLYRFDMHFREQGEFHDGIGVIDMYMRQEGLTDVFQAYSDLDNRFSLGMPRKDSPEYRKRLSERARGEAVLADLQDYFVWNLANNVSDKARKTRRYLTEERGFSMEQVSRLKLGFVPEWGTVIRYIVGKKGHSLEDLEAVCEVRNDEGRTSVGKTHTLAIPYTCAGVLKGFMFRRIEDGKGPKYIASQDLDRKSAFFNIPADCKGREIIVVEGEFDALKATAEGVENVVAIGGSEIAGERRSQVEDALRRGANGFILCLDLDADKDDPSQAKSEDYYRHVMRSIHTIKDVDLDYEKIYIAQFSKPMDPDEYIRKYGVDSFYDLISNVVPYWKFVSDWMTST